VGTADHGVSGLAKQCKLAGMALDPAQLPKDVATLQAMLIAAQTRLLDRDAEIANLKLTIAKMRRETFGASSERGTKLIDQLELQLADLVEAATEAKSAAAIAKLSPAEDVQKPARRPLPGHLLRERVVQPVQATCPDCGGQLRKLGEDITETLELAPATWKVIQLCAREALLPHLRAHHAGSCALASDCARAGRPATAGPGAIREIPRAHPAEPAERNL
jgi:hypothetical protein